MNRITEAIRKAEGKIEQARIEGKDLATLEGNLNLSTGEFVVYQNTQAHAFASGRISFEEAQTTYRILNNWETATLAEKVTVTRLINELMTNKMARR